MSWEKLKKIQAAQDGNIYSAHLVCTAASPAAVSMQPKHGAEAAKVGRWGAGPYARVHDDHVAAERVRAAGRVRTVLFGMWGAMGWGRVGWGRVGWGETCP